MPPKNQSEGNLLLFKMSIPRITPILKTILNIITIAYALLNIAYIKAMMLTFLDVAQLRSQELCFLVMKSTIITTSYVPKPSNIFMSEKIFQLNVLIFAFRLLSNAESLDNSSDN